MKNAVENLRNEFPNRPPAYAETVVDRFEENMEKIEKNKRVFDNTTVETEGIKAGYRFRMGDGLYEVVVVKEGNNFHEPRALIAKVLDTKVSEARNNFSEIDISKLKEAPAFDRYNEMVNKVYELMEE